MSPKKILLFSLFGLLILYALFQARFLILGPRVSITSPKDGAGLQAGLTTVTGTAHNIVFISLDDRPIFTDEAGTFSESLLLPPGPGSIIVKARDRFGRETEKLVNVVVTQ